MKKTIAFLLSVAALSAAAEITVVRDVPYYADLTNAYQSAQCTLDISTPSSATNLPVLLFFHGGGLTGGKKHFPEMNRSNLVVITAEYRLYPKAPFPCFIEDAAAAVAWTFRHAAAYGGDPRKIYVSGHSAGGYLTAMVGMDPRWLKPHTLSPHNLAGIIPVSAQVTTHFNVKKMLSYPGEQYRPLITPEAPLYYCSSNLPPICIVVGDRAIEWPARVEENELMAASLRALKHPCVEFHEIPGKNHGTVGPAAGPFVAAFIRKIEAKAK